MNSPFVHHIDSDTNGSSELTTPAIFILRLYSIYGRNDKLLYCLVVLLMTELSVKIVSLVFALIFQMSQAATSGHSQMGQQSIFRPVWSGVF